MLMRSSIRKVFTRPITCANRKVPQQAHLAAEELENRWVPSTIVVNNPTDTPVAGETDLRQAIAQANTTGGNETITFDKTVFRTPQTITLNGTQLELSDTNGTETITGPKSGVTVSGDGLSRIFQVDSGVNASISGMTITDGAVAGNGGGLANYGVLSLTNCTVSDNIAYADSSGNYGSGGGIENDGSLTVSQCTFTNNLATGGAYAAPITGAITEGSAGGAIDSEGTSLTVSSSTFTSNEVIGPSKRTGEGNGGAINSSSPATISDSKFNDNEALGRLTNGGAISTGENETFAAPTLAISNCTFTSNEAVGANDTNNSTALFGGEALGGAIANAGPLTIASSSFTDNLAKGGDQGDNVGGVDPDPVLGEAYGGGVVNFASSLAIDNTSFNGNQAIGGDSAVGPGAPAAGGGLAAEIFAVTNLTNVTFVGNQAIGGNGGSSSPGYPGTGGSGFGGGFYNGVDSTASVSNSLFSDNLAKGGSGGSGANGGVGVGAAMSNGGGAGAFELIFLGLGADASSLSISASSLFFNVAQGGAGGVGGNGGNGLGGGVYVLGGTAASIETTLIATNAAVGGSAGNGGGSGQGIGGGLYLDTGAVVTLSNPDEVILNFANTSNHDIFGIYVD